MEGGTKKYEIGPIEDSELKTVLFPGNKESQVLTVYECEKSIDFLKNGLLPDPRVQIPKLRQMKCFDEDIFICAYPKCGTHWVSEMCSMLVKGKVEFNDIAKEQFMLEFHLPDEYDDVPPPRIFNTHLNPVCLPQEIVSKKCKIIFIHRNPKDMFTSLYHHYKNTKEEDVGSSWASFLKYIFENDRQVSSNWFFYNKQWSNFRQSNSDVPFLSISYEELKKEPLKNLAKIGDFIGYAKDEDFLKAVLEKCSLDKMKDIENKRPSGTAVVSSEKVAKLYRKGIVGDWKNQFTVAENEQFDAFLKTHLSEEELNFIYEV